MSLGVAAVGLRLGCVAVGVGPCALVVAPAAAVVFSDCWHHCGHRLLLVPLLLLGSSLSTWPTLTSPDNCLPRARLDSHVTPNPQLQRSDAAYPIRCWVESCPRAFSSQQSGAAVISAPFRIVPRAVLTPFLKGFTPFLRRSERGQNHCWPGAWGGGRW